jgi:hypothetical protein
MKENYKKHKIKGLLIIWHSELNTFAFFKGMPRHELYTSEVVKV